MIRGVQNKYREYVRNMQIHELLMSNRHIDINMFQKQINSQNMKDENRVQSHNIYIPYTPFYTHDLLLIPTDKTAWTSWLEEVGSTLIKNVEIKTGEEIIYQSGNCAE